jgi:hypothetical protein
MSRSVSRTACKAGNTQPSLHPSFCPPHVPPPSTSPSLSSLLLSHRGTHCLCQARVAPATRPFPPPPLPFPLQAAELGNALQELLKVVDPGVLLPTDLVKFRMKPMVEPLTGRLGVRRAFAPSSLLCLVCLRRDPHVAGAHPRGHRGTTRHRVTS